MLVSAATREEAVAEALWLVQLHANWTSPAVTANVTSMQPAPSDPSGAFLEQLRLWREQRIASVEFELGRLAELWNISSSEIDVHAQRQDNVAKFGADTLKAGGSRIDGNFSSNSTDPWQRLLDWMRHNGAVVRIAWLTACIRPTLWMRHKQGGAVFYASLDRSSPSHRVCFVCKESNRWMLLSCRRST